MSKKSQAALEFLTTYAWAFLVIMIMVGALAYFGILSPSKLLPDRCIIGPEFGCMDYIIFQNGLTLKLKNNVGKPIIVDSIAVSTESGELSCSPSEKVGDGTIWREESNDIYITCLKFLTLTGFREGKKRKIEIKDNIL